MAVTAASGTISTKLSQWKTSLSNSSTFQTATNAANANAALGHIYRRKVDSTIDGFARALIDLHKMRPYWIVWHIGGRGQKDGKGHSHSGSIGSLLTWDVPAEIKDNESEIDLQFGNLYGGIYDDIWDMPFTDGRLPVESIDWGQSQRHSLRRIVAQGDVMTIEWTIDWAK